MRIKDYQLLIAFICLVLAFWVVYGEYSRLIAEIGHFEPLVSYKREIPPPLPERTTQQRVYERLGEKYIDINSWHIECLLYYENRDWDEFAVHINNDGSYDRGLFQLNNRNAPFEIDNKCAFNAICSLDKFIDYVNNGGSLDRWYGYKYNCH